MKNNLWFQYKSNSRVRFLKSNCYEHPEYPLIYRIITEKLDFIVPRRFTIFSGKYVYTTLDVYKKVIDEYDKRKHSKTT